MGGAWEEREDGRREEREERARRILLLHRYFLLVLLGNFRVVDHGDGVCIFVAREVLCACGACAQKSVAKERKKERMNE